MSMEAPGGNSQGTFPSLSIMPIPEGSGLSPPGEKNNEISP